MRLTSFVVAALTTLAASSALAQDVVLTLNTPGGSIQEGGRAVLWGPAAEKLGYAVKEETSENSLDALRLEYGANAVNTDILVMGGYQAAIAGTEGMLEPLDYDVIDASNFLPGSAAPYCIGIYGFAAVMAWNTDTYGDKAPQTWADFWDVEKFPGSRAMRSDAEAQVEMALLADGVAAQDLYTVLDTREGKERAIAKIAELKPSVAVWWSSGAQHSQLMKDGEVDMSTGWNGRFQAAKDAGGPAGYTFNGGVLGYDCFAVAKGSKHKAEAMKLINAMSTGEAQARFTEYVAYGPLNRDAYSTGLIDPKLEPLLPTSPEYADTLIVQDIDWWARNNNEIQEMFQDMLTR